MTMLLSYCQVKTTSYKLVVHNGGISGNLYFKTLCHLAETIEAAFHVLMKLIDAYHICMTVCYFAK